MSLSVIQKVDILAFGVHPDDVELSSIGTLMKHKDLGYTFGLCDLTQGELGTRGSGALRLIEAQNAALYSGATFRVNLGFEDGFIQNNKATIFEICRIIRQSQPTIVLANSLDDRHPDHARAAKIVQDACFYAGLPKIEIVNESGKNLNAHRPKAIYHYIQDKMLKPDFVVDITSYIDQKVKSIQKFSSQFFIDENDEGPKTPISGKDFIEYIKAKDKVFGRSTQVDYAEGFNVARVPEVQNLFVLK
jgi:N-acetylglucosamine malate deacetylase 1